MQKRFFLNQLSLSMLTDHSDVEYQALFQALLATTVFQSEY